MKQRRYTITSGRYEDYQIIAQLVGPARPAGLTLWKQFAAEYGIPDEVESSYKGASIVAQEIAAYQRRMSEALDRLETEGYGDRIAPAFVEWLKRHHGFTDSDVDEFYVPGD